MCGVIQKLTQYPVVIQKTNLHHFVALEWKEAFAKRDQKNTITFYIVYGWKWAHACLGVMRMCRQSEDCQSAI